jgi:hypothetical protein
VAPASHQIAHILRDEQEMQYPSQDRVLSMQSLPLAPSPPKRPLTETDAVDIWIARWLRIRRKDLLARYRCDPRRLYEIWQGERFPGSRAKALEVFAERFPGLLDRVDFGRHRRIPRAVPAELQPRLFD